jgi:hypothetical protein
MANLCFRKNPQWRAGSGGVQHLGRWEVNAAGFAVALKLDRDVVGRAQVVDREALDRNATFAAMGNEPWRRLA